MSVQLEFKEENGTFYLYDRGRMISGYRDLVFCFDYELGTLQKFGERIHVEDWHAKATKKLLQAGFHDHARELIIVGLNEFAGHKWEIDDINRFINTSGYIKTWFDRMVEEASKMEEQPEVIDLSEDDLKHNQVLSSSMKRLSFS